MLPSIYSENLFDDFFSDPFDMVMPRSLNALYGKHGKNLMKTDVRETEDTYELDIDLPGFKKDEVNLELKDGYLTIQAAKGLDKEEPEKKGKYIRQERYAGACSRSFYVGEHVEPGGHPREVRKRHPADLSAEGRKEAAPEEQCHCHRVTAYSISRRGISPCGIFFCEGTLKMRTKASQSLRSQAQRK